MVATSDNTQALPIPPGPEAREIEIVRGCLEEAGLELVLDTARYVESDSKHGQVSEPNRAKGYIIRSGDGTSYVAVVGETWTRVPGPQPAFSWYHYPRVVGVVTDPERVGVALNARNASSFANRVSGIGPIDKSARERLKATLDRAFQAAESEVRALYRLPAST